MKKILLLALICAPVAALAQSTPPPINVVVRSEVEDLAQGFAAAFSAIGTTPVTVTYERDGKITTIVGVKAVEASRGVLVVHADSGLVYLLNPRDIISISDAPPPKS
jgi:hypothetical protein